MYENSHSLLDLQSCIESFIKLTSSWESLVISSTNRIKCVWAVKFLKKLIILAYFALRLHDWGLCDKNSSCVTVLYHPMFPWSSCSHYKVTLVTWSYWKILYRLTLEIILFKGCPPPRNKLGRKYENVELVCFTRACSTIFLRSLLSI